MQPQQLNTTSGFYLVARVVVLDPFPAPILLRALGHIPHDLVV
jgi:hypothetical protein